MLGFYSPIGLKRIVIHLSFLPLCFSDNPACAEFPHPFSGGVLWKLEFWVSLVPWDLSTPLQGIKAEMAAAKPLAGNRKFSLPSLINSVEQTFSTYVFTTENHHFPWYMPTAMLRGVLRDPELPLPFVILKPWMAGDSYTHMKLWHQAWFYLNALSQPLWLFYMCWFQTFSGCSRNEWLLTHLVRGFWWFSLRVPSCIYWP